MAFVLPGGLLIALVLWYLSRKGTGSPLQILAGGSSSGGGGPGGGPGLASVENIGGGAKPNWINEALALVNKLIGGGSAKSLLPNIKDVAANAQVAQGKALASLNPLTEQEWTSGFNATDFGPGIDSIVNPSPVDIGTLPALPVGGVSSLSEPAVSPGDFTAGGSGFDFGGDLGGGGTSGFTDFGGGSDWAGSDTGGSFDSGGFA